MSYFQLWKWHPKIYDWRRMLCTGYIFQCFGEVGYSAVLIRARAVLGVGHQKLAHNVILVHVGSASMALWTGKLTVRNLLLQYTSVTINIYCASFLKFPFKEAKEDNERGLWMRCWGMWYLTSNVCRTWREEGKPCFLYQMSAFCEAACVFSVSHIPEYKWTCTQWIHYTVHTLCTCTVLVKLIGCM